MYRPLVKGEYNEFREIKRERPSPSRSPSPSRKRRRGAYPLRLLPVFFLYFLIKFRRRNRSRSPRRRSPYRPQRSPRRHSRERERYWIFLFLSVYWPYIHNFRRWSRSRDRGRRAGSSPRFCCSIISNSFSFLDAIVASKVAPLQDQIDQIETEEILNYGTLWIFELLTISPSSGVENLRMHFLFIV